MATTFASAPGKVLVAGGYLVLRPPLIGLVLSSTARFHVQASWQVAGSPVELPQCDAAARGGPSDAQQALPVHVISPQFHSEWRYQLQLAAPFRLSAASDAQTKNVFVERTIDVTLATLDAVLPSGKLAAVLHGAAARGATLQLKLQADNDFYSQKQHLLDRELPVCTASLASLPQFMPCPVDKEGKAVIAKTGMGSSAGLVTALAAALVGHFHAAVLPDAKGDTAAAIKAVTAAGGELDPACGKRLVHHIAQVAHAWAQGKVGSGFDVCAAVFGSMKYKRVPPATLAAMLDTAEASFATATTAADAGAAGTGTGAGAGAGTGTSTTTAAGGNIGEILATSRAADWDYSVEPFALPRGLELMMADVCGGSETPSMVKKVLAWLKDGGDEAQNAWDSLGATNDAIAACVHKLHAEADANAAEYDAEIARCAGLAAADWGTSTTTASLLGELRRLFAVARNGLRAMGEAASVPIEPKEQESLANATMAVPGVVAAGVPGAGGFDALFAIMLTTSASPTPREQVEATWLANEGGSLTPLLMSAEVAGPGAGLRVEQA